MKLERKVKKKTGAGGRLRGGVTLEKLASDIEMLRVAVKALATGLKVSAEHRADATAHLSERIAAVERVAAVTEFQHDALCREMIKSPGNERFAKCFVSVRARQILASDVK